MKEEAGYVAELSFDQASALRWFHTQIPMQQDFATEVFLCVPVMPIVRVEPRGIFRKWVDVKSRDDQNECFKSFRECSFVVDVV